MNNAKLLEMAEVIDARLSPEFTWDTNQKAAVLHEAGYTEEEVNEYFEENAPF